MAGSSSPASFAPGTLLMAALLTVLTSAQGLLTSASKTGSGYAYDFAAVPFLAELVKLGISYGLLMRQRRADPGSIRITHDARTVGLFIVPSLIYMFHNNVQVVRLGLWVGCGCCGGGGGAAHVLVVFWQALGRPCRTENQPPSSCHTPYPPPHIPASFSSSSLSTRPPTRSWATSRS